MNELDEQFAVEIGSRIRHRRLAMGMTKKDLAARAGLHPKTISLVEAGKTSLFADTFIRIVGGLGDGGAEIMEGIEWVPAPTLPSGRWRFRPETTEPAS